MLTENIDYTYIFPAKSDNEVHIKLLTGAFEGTIFKYGKVKFEEKNDEGYLHFAYDVIECKNVKPKKLEKNEDFKNYIGDLLLNIIANRLEESNENGTTDTEESYL